MNYTLPISFVQSYVEITISKKFCVLFADFKVSDYKFDDRLKRRID